MANWSFIRKSLVATGITTFADSCLQERILGYDIREGPKGMAPYRIVLNLPVPEDGRVVDYGDDIALGVITKHL